ncbi:hypothetical protein [Oscillibacter sp.]|uniref:hypothetical protein n=1 Tax=Oscillibacter sp. TaxID=1945593 RepID=UPI00289F0957|nr:hypothetical protein [Oscillibacter sp.]
MPFEMDPEYQEVFGDYGGEEDEPLTPDGAESGQEPEGNGDPEQPGADNPEEGEGPLENPPPEETNEPAKLPEQSAEERHRQAAARRDREWEAYERANQARRDKIYADMFRGQTDPYTGKPITTEAEYLAFEENRQRKNQETVLQEAGIKPDVLESLIDQRVSQHPAVTAAQQAAAAARAQQAMAAEQQAQGAIAEELQKITAIDPAVKPLEDIAKMPTAAEFNRYVQRGNTLEEAFYLANRKDIEQKRLAAAKQTAINQTRSKQGLLSGAGEGAPGISVPAADAAAYREWFPDATDEEIAKNWSKFEKSCR